MKKLYKFTFFMGNTEVTSEFDVTPKELEKWKRHFAKFKGSARLNTASGGEIVVNLSRVNTFRVEEIN